MHEAKIVDLRASILHFFSFFFFPPFFFSHRSILQGCLTFRAKIRVINRICTGWASFEYNIAWKRYSTVFFIVHLCHGARISHFPLLCLHVVPLFVLFCWIHGGIL